ncbi:hypothetical protein [Rhodopila globiformis]|uniref:Uncharacterized protein n=1 Tax=Rhodopila globiformis TaxID=1071 RepID=A0A2S6NB66_RHOGL|nr:hypothetical protein [Rhodopila globiformis]PPQ31858.1 hypothetical protein CCS01_16730 [Rhodopila globiformis]
MPGFIPRTPWPADFPEVAIHSVQKIRDSHPFYAAAKSGDPVAAKALVMDLLAMDAADRLGRLLAGRRPLVLAVTADEVTGFNVIPDAMAQALAAELGLAAAAGCVVQSTKVGHTKASGWHRLVTPPLFTGDVVAGADYRLVDDHVGFGGTLANLRGFVEHHGGHVPGMTTLTETREARHSAVRQDVPDVLSNKHGYELEQFWRAEFGHGTECLTNIEAGYLCRVESVAAIKDRMAEAAESARRRGFSAGFEMPPDSPGGLTGRA